MDDLKYVGEGVVDVLLLVIEGDQQGVVLNAVVAERAGQVEAEGLHVAGHHLHGGNAAIANLVDEFCSSSEGQVTCLPQAEAVRVGQRLDLGRAGGGDIDHPRARDTILQFDARLALERPCGLAAFGLLLEGSAHRMTLVEG